METKEKIEIEALAIVLGGISLLYFNGAIISAIMKDDPVPQITEVSQATQAEAIIETIDYDVVQLSGKAPQGLDIDSETGLVYVLHNGTVVSYCESDKRSREGANTMSIVDPSKKEEIVNVETVGGPVWPLVDKLRNVVYSAGSAQGLIAVHDLTTGERVDLLEVGGRPHAFGLTSEGLLIVSNTYKDSQKYMSVIDADTLEVLGHQKVAELPHGIAADQKEKVFYMVGVRTGEVSVISMESGKVIDSFETLNSKNGFGNSNMLAWSEKYRLLFISDYSENPYSILVYDVDARQTVKKLTFKDAPNAVWGMQVDEDAGLLYAAIPNADSIGVVDIATLTELGSFKVDECPYAVRLDTKRGLGYSTGSVNATLSIFSLEDVAEFFKN